MKVSRAELKSVVKECLLEILTEGMGESLVEARQTIRQPSKNQQRKMIREQKAVTRSMQPQLRQAVMEAAGGNDVLASILADTANSTMQEQLAAESRLGAGMGSRQLDGVAGAIVENSTPDELFGEETMSKWADLAFS